MTCIAGLEASEKVYIGADSAGVTGWDLVVRADKKVFRNGPFIMGFTTSFRMGQILQYAYSPPERPSDVSIEKYMATTFVDSVRAALKAGGFAKVESEVESGGEFLVGYRGRLFYVGPDFQIGEAAAGFMAIGCGNQIAIGSLFSTAGEQPEARILTALTAAERFNAAVRGPFTILGER